MPNILPMVDDDVADVVKKEFEKRGISVKVGTKIASVEVFDGEVDAVTEDGEHLRSQKVLVVYRTKAKCNAEHRSGTWN